MNTRRFPSAVRGLMLASLTVLLAGCVGSTSGQLVPSSALSDSGRFYVERHADDGRDLAANIAQSMRARGLAVEHGTVEERPAEFDYLVTYTDRWMWDMRMYLSDLRIEVRDPVDGSLVGYGQSAQSSLKAMGKTHDDVIELALSELLGPR